MVEVEDSGDVMLGHGSWLTPMEVLKTDDEGGEEQSCPSPGELVLTHGSLVY